MMLMRRVWDFIRMMPIARYIKPLWKSAVIQVVQDAGDSVQLRLREAMEENGLAGVLGVLTTWRDSVVGVLWVIPLPRGIEARIISEIDEEMDSLRALIGRAAAGGGVQAVLLAFDKGFDACQSAIIARIKTL